MAHLPIHHTDHGRARYGRDDDDEDAGDDALDGSVALSLDLHDHVPPEFVLLRKQHVEVQRHVVEPVGRVLNGRRRDVLVLDLSCVRLDDRVQVVAAEHKRRLLE